MHPFTKDCCCNGKGVHLFRPQLPIYRYVEFTGFPPATSERPKRDLAGIHSQHKVPFPSGLAFLYGSILRLGGQSPGPKEHSWGGSYSWGWVYLAQFSGGLWLKPPNEKSRYYVWAPASSSQIRVCVSNQVRQERSKWYKLSTVRKPHRLRGLHNFFYFDNLWQRINKPPLRSEDTVFVSSPGLLSLGLAGNFLVACWWVYSVLTSKPGICFLHSDNLFLSVVKFVDLCSDKEVDEACDKEDQQTSQSQI